MIYVKPFQKGFFETPSESSYEISNELHQQLIFQQSQGCILVFGETSVVAELPPAPTFQEQVLMYTSNIQSLLLDATAKSMGYDSIFTAVTYADEYAVAKFQEEGSALRVWRSLVWAEANSILADVSNEVIPAPTVGELIAMLPVFEMPE
jgi:hypothetical protein